MVYFNRLVTGLMGVVISVTSFATSASGQASDKFVNLGSDSAGNPILLDKESIQDTSFETYQQVPGEQVMVSSFEAACGEARLFTTGAISYTRSGVKLGESKKREELHYQKGSAAGNAMQFICRRIGARGW
jgi:hypothetical protein